MLQLIAAQNTGDTSEVEGPDLKLGTYGTRPLLNDLCECINPWEGQTFNQHIGEPKNTCPNFCYVSCNSKCRDKKPAKGKGRCYSELGCNNRGSAKQRKKPTKMHWTCTA